MRQKTVFSDLSQIAHLWANQHQSEARNSSRNLFFNNDTIYSYGHHFPIGKHVKNNAGEYATLFTLRTYSKTTAGHISIVHQAARHKNLIYCYFPNIYEHSANFEQWQKNILNEAKKLERAKKPHLYLTKIEHLSNQVNKYAEFFSLDIPLTLQSAMNIKDKTQYKAFEEKRQELIKQEEKIKAKKIKEAHRKELKKFLNFEVNRIYSDIKKDFLRLNTELNIIETSQGVKIQISEAQALYLALKNDIAKVSDKISHYSINYLDNKIVKIGCHNFDKKYLLTFGKNL